MNSLIQQLYMINQFRNIIYEIPVLDDNVDTNPLYQLQLLFANLSHSIKVYHPPMHFIKSFTKAFNNEVINVSQQQDCEEFLNILIDNLELTVKGTKHVCYYLLIPIINYNKYSKYNNYIIIAIIITFNFT